MIINNNYDLEITLNNVSLLNNTIATNVQCIIHESISEGIPTCNLRFVAPVAFLTRFAIVDGAKLIIRINSKTYDIDDTYYFRVSNMSATPISKNQNSFSLEAILDVYELFRDPHKYASCCTSAELFERVAELNSWPSLVYSTQDRQLWTASERNLGMMLNNVAMHGWNSDTSGMYWFMGRKKELYYIDIDRLFFEAKNYITFKIGQSTESDIQNKVFRYNSATINTNTGKENLFDGGYGGNNYNFSLGDYKYQLTNANKVRAVSEIININKELSQGLHSQFACFDVGNFHPHYFTAANQNERILSTFSTYINLSCEVFRPVRLSQIAIANISATDATNDGIQSMNIKYLVSDIYIKMNSSNIQMDVQLCSQGYSGTSTETY